MKLYVFPPSPNAFFPLAVLHQLQLPAEIEVVDLTQGATHTETYRALNPNELMPTLVDGDFKLWESTAIAQYLCSKKEGQTLWPASPGREQADVSRWLSWRLAHFGPACGTLIFQNYAKELLGDGTGPDPVKVAEGNEQVRKYGEVLNAHLAQRDWLVGSRPTLAEFTLTPFLHYAEPARMPLDGLDNLHGWVARVVELEGFQKAIPAPPQAAARASKDEE